MKTSLIRRRITTTTLFVACALGATVASAKEGRSGRDRGAYFFEKIDVNKDGKISKTESSRAADARFKTMDANNDGVITGQEIQAARDAHRSARSEKGTKRGNDKARKGGHRRGHGGHFAKLDANNDGKITRAEGQSAAAARFARADANGDGAITREEMTAAHERHHEGRRRGKQACGERKGKDKRSARTP